MMPPLFTRVPIFPAVFLGEDLLPTLLFRGVGILAVHGIGQLNTAPTFGQILFVNRLDLLEVVLERCLGELFMTPSLPGILRLAIPALNYASS